MCTLTHIILLERWLRDEQTLPSPRRAVELLTLAAAHSPAAFATVDLSQLIANTQLVDDDAWPYLLQIEVLHAVWKVLLANVAEPNVARYALRCCPWLPAYEGALRGLLSRPPTLAVGQVLAEEGRHRMAASIALALVLQGRPAASLLRSLAANLVMAAASERGLADHIRDDRLSDRPLSGMIAAAGFQRAWALWSFCEAIRLAPTLAPLSVVVLTQPAR